jgi:hypothetical protein
MEHHLRLLECKTFHLQIPERLLLFNYLSISSPIQLTPAENVEDLLPMVKMMTITVLSDRRQKSNNLRWNHDLQEQLLILYSNFKKDKNVEKGLKQAFWMEDVILSILSNISSFFCRKIWNPSLLFTNSLYI